MTILELPLSHCIVAVRAGLKKAPAAGDGAEGRMTQSRAERHNRKESFLCRPAAGADRDVLTALVSIVQDTGDLAAALSHARELAALDPGDMRVRELLLDLEK